MDEAAAVLKEVMGEVGDRECPGPALRAACLAVRDGAAQGVSPFTELVAAAGLADDNLPADDGTLWLALAVPTVAPAGADLDVTAWLGVIAALTLWGAGTQADARALATYVGEDAEIDPKELETAFEPVVRAWLALGVLSGTERLTPLGWWGIPEAQLQAWS